MRVLTLKMRIYDNIIIFFNEIIKIKGWKDWSLYFSLEYTRSSMVKINGK